MSIHEFAELHLVHADGTFVISSVGGELMLASGMKDYEVEIRLPILWIKVTLFRDSIVKYFTNRRQTA